MTMMMVMMNLRDEVHFNLEIQSIGNHSSCQLFSIADSGRKQFPARPQIRETGFDFAGEFRFIVISSFTATPILSPPGPSTRTTSPTYSQFIGSCFEVKGNVTKTRIPA